MIVVKVTVFLSILCLLKFGFSEMSRTRYDEHRYNDDLDPNYPLEEIETFFTKYPNAKEYFYPNIQIGPRGGWPNIDDDPDSESLCLVRTNRYYAPQILPNLQGEIKTIINHSQYQQFIETEQCIHPDKSDHKCNNINIGFISVCRQNYKAVKLASFNNRTGMAFELFKIPACCVCKLIKAD